MSIFDKSPRPDHAWMRAADAYLDKRRKVRQETDDARGSFAGSGWTAGYAAGFQAATAGNPRPEREVKTCAAKEWQRDFALAYQEGYAVGLRDGGDQ